MCSKMSNNNMRQVKKADKNCAGKNWEKCVHFSYSKTFLICIFDAKPVKECKTSLYLNEQNLIQCFFNA